jgi:large subunit ribosomal protein L10
MGPPGVPGSKTAGPRLPECDDGREEWPSGPRQARPAETGSCHCSVPCLARGSAYRVSGSWAHIKPSRIAAGAEGGEFNLNRTEKEEVIGQLHAKMAKAKTAILAEPKGLDVATVTELRRKCREAQVEYRIVKNTLAIRAAKGTPLEALSEKFVGPTALVMSYGDVVAPAKILADFAKDRENFALRAGVVEGKVIDAKGIQALSKMPGLPELRSRIAGVLTQPATMLVRLLGTPGQQLAQVLGARKDQLEKQS